MLLSILWSCSNVEVEHVSPLEVDNILHEYNFAIIGDYGDQGAGAKEVSDLVKSWDPEFILTLGDNNYPDGSLSDMKKNISDYYGDYIYNPDAPNGYINTGNASNEKHNRFFPSIGNHDKNPEDNYTPYLSYFTLPGNEQHYTFIKGDIHFFVLNSDSMLKSSPTLASQSLWLQRCLSESTSKVKMVYFHHPPFSTSKHGSHPEMQLPFEEWGADIVLSGHEHSYQRIEKMDNPNFHYIVNGLGGRPYIYDCDKNPLNHNEFNVLCYNKSHGAIKVSITADVATFKFISVNPDEDEIDSFIINIE